MKFRDLGLKWLKVVDKLGHMERHVGEKRRECDVARSREGLVGLSRTVGIFYNILLVSFDTWHFHLPPQLFP